MTREAALKAVLNMRRCLNINPILLGREMMKEHNVSTKIVFAVLLGMTSMFFSSCAITLRESNNTLTIPNYETENKNSESNDEAADKDNVIEETEFVPTEPEETEEIAETTETAAETEAADPYENVDISFIATGDNLIHPNIYIDAYDRGNDEKRYDFLTMYSDVADYIASADIAFINQETVMAGEEYGYSGYPCFNAPRQLGLDMVTLGFDIVNIANNHMLDMGASGLESTIEFWNEQSVLLLGGYLNEEDASNIRTLEKDGVKMAFLSYTLSTNGIVKNASSEVVIPYIDDAQILSDMEKAREICDILIVSIHWGDENTQTPNSEQIRLSKLISNAGADVILGHHSHTLQPIEWIERDDGGRTLCIYSLGNFVSGMARPVNQVGGFLSFHIRSDGNGSLEIAEPSFNPTVFYYGMDWYNTHVYFLEDYTDEIASTHGVQISGYYLSVSDARAYVTNVIENEFLPDWLKQ